MATDMNILCPKFFGQALRESSDAKFAHCKRACGSIAPDRGCSACEDEGTLLPCTTLPTFTRLFKVVLGELEQDFSGEGKGSEGINIQRLADFLFGDVEERLPYTIPGIEHCNTKGGSRHQEAIPDVGERGTDGGWSIIGHCESCGLIVIKGVVKTRTRLYKLRRTSPPS